MAKIYNIEKANECNSLWPPIADAVDTFLRRRTGGCESYEKTWRLIHVWEVIVTTLSSIAVARIKTIDSSVLTYRRCREFLYGKSWDRLNETWNIYQSAFDGSIDKRIDILFELSVRENPESNFLSSVRSFLLTPTLELSSLISAWGRVCDVPGDANITGNIQVKTAMRQINSFRNRFAHVPFPYDGLDDIAEALENVTEQLFSVEPYPWQSFPHDDCRLESPLSGAIHWRDRLLHGSGFKSHKNKSQSTYIDCVFPSVPKKNCPPEIWDSQPFIFRTYPKIHKG